MKALYVLLWTMVSQIWIAGEAFSSSGSLSFTVLQGDQYQWGVQAPSLDIADSKRKEKNNTSAKPKQQWWASYSPGAKGSY